MFVAGDVFVVGTDCKFSYRLSRDDEVHLRARLHLEGNEVLSRCKEPSVEGRCRLLVLGRDHRETVL